MIYGKIATCYLCFTHTLVFTASLVLEKQEREREQRASSGSYTLIFFLEYYLSPT